MAAKKHQFVTILLFIVLCANLLNVQVARADGETPTQPPASTESATEPPPATEVAAEPSIESTPEPVEATPAPVEATADSSEELLTPVPQYTEIVVLDETGDPLPLATQEAAQVTEVNDPMWCPQGVLPGGSGCSVSFGAISDLLSDMKTNTSFYTQNGIIYFTATATESFTLTRGFLGGTDFTTLNVFDLTLQGGWNGSTDAPSFSGQTDLGNNSIVIGGSTTGGGWEGNITLNDIVFHGVSTASALTIYTTAGNITLSNVDVIDQAGDYKTGILSSSSGNITIQNGSTFDGNDANSSGFSATTSGSGSIAISDTSFTQVEMSSSAYDGARLNAATVTLTNVTATSNDGNGIRIDGANVVTLNNVTASDNGTVNSGAGVFVNGNPGSRLIIIGGTFNNNAAYGIRVGIPANTTVYIQSAPTCTGNRSGCYNDTTIFDNTPPLITSTVSGTGGVGGLYRSDVSVNWSVTDPESGVVSSSSGCASTTLTGETSGTTITCSATNNAGLSSSESVTIKIDKSSPVLNTPDITVEATGSTGAAVSYSASAMDGMDGSVSATCSPASGTIFPLGATTVSCSAIDLAGNTSSAAFLVTVQDTTAPSIAPHADIIASTNLRTGRHISYTSPSTFDIVDGAGIASCSPTSGAFFLLGPTEVTCIARDSHGNSATSGFFIHVDRSDQTSTSASSSSSTSVVPLTSGEAIALDCNSTLWAFGIKLSFTQLCDHQAKFQQVNAKDLPAPLSDGFSFAMGLSVDVLNNGQLLKDLPDGASIQLDFPLAGGTKDQFAVLHWDGNEWVEVASQDGGDPSSGMIITTDMTGIFVLVKK